MSTALTTRPAVTLASSVNLLLISADVMSAGALAAGLRTGLGVGANIRWMAPTAPEINRLVRAADVLVLDLRLDSSLAINLIEPMRALNRDAAILAVIDANQDCASRLIQSDADDIVVATQSDLVGRQLIVSIQRLLNARRSKLAQAPEPASIADFELIRTENHRLREQIARLESLAASDALTGLANRRAADERTDEHFSASLRHGWDLACLMIDLDGLKRINDTLGHSRGDELIRLAADTIRSSIRRSDFAARLGGDEFIVLLPQTSMPTAQILADRLRERFSIRCGPLQHELHAADASNTIAGLKVHVRVSNTGPAVENPDSPIGMSIGVASRVGVLARSASDMIARADDALYAAKRSGKGRVRVGSPVAAAA